MKEQETFNEFERTPSGCIDQLGTCMVLAVLERCDGRQSGDQYIDILVHGGSANANEMRVAVTQYGTMVPVTAIWLYECAKRFGMEDEQRQILELSGSTSLPSRRERVYTTGASVMLADIAVRIDQMVQDFPRATRLPRLLFVGGANIKDDNPESPREADNDLALVRSILTKNDERPMPERLGNLLTVIDNQGRHIVDNFLVTGQYIRNHPDELQHTGRLLVISPTPYYLRYIYLAQILKDFYKDIDVVSVLGMWTEKQLRRHREELQKDVLKTILLLFRGQREKIQAHIRSGVSDF